MHRVTVINAVLMTMLIGFSAFAGTPQELGKWKEGELLLENHSFEDDLAAWELEDGTCCDRGGEYKMEIDRKNPQHGDKCLKVIGVKPLVQLGMQRSNKGMFQCKKERRILSFSGRVPKPHAKYL